jgi:Ca2+-binding EF-hand superfamily protein
MTTLLADNFYKTSKYIFDFYDFDRDGHITKEDIRVVLSYVSLSKIINKKNINDMNSKKLGAYSNFPKIISQNNNFER